MRRLTSIVLVLALVIGCVAYSPTGKASAKTKTISDYMSASFDVYKAYLVKSQLEFDEIYKANELVAAVDEPYNIEAVGGGVSGVTNTFTAKTDGCLLFKVEKGDFLRGLEIVDVTQKKTATVFAYKYTKNYANTVQIPVIAGHEYEIRKSIGYTYSATITIKLYFGFIAQTSTFSIDHVTEKDNKTIEVTVGNVYASGTDLSVFAVGGEKGTNDVIAETVTYQYTATEDKGDAILVLPDDGVYTLKINTLLEGTPIAYQVFVLDTTKYLKPTLDAPETPYSALAGTNVIVGVGEPSATVYASYNGHEYKGKANRSGIYKIVLDEDMVEGNKIKLWQKKNGLTSKKSSTRVTTE